MKKTAMSILAAFAAMAAAAATRTEALREKLLSGDRDYVFVAMHRGDWRNFPENSKDAILSSIACGADIVELDVRMTKEGRFVLMHDKDIGRTTTGKGKVSDYTVPQLKKLKMTFQGKPTQYDILTLEEALELTRGRILVNLDKFTEHPREILDAVAAAGALKEVLVKVTRAPDDTKKLFGPYWKDVENGNLLFMPVVQFCWKKHKFAKKILPEWLALEPRKGSMFEICFDDRKFVKPALDPVRKAPGAPRIWINTMWDSLSAGHSDKEALTDPGRVWGWSLEQGATMLQTDCGPELVLYLTRIGRHTLESAPAPAPAAKK